MSVIKQGRLSSWVASRLRVKSIRGQLALGLTVTLVPWLAVAFFFTNRYVKSRVYKLTEHRLQAEAELVAYGLRQWGVGISHTVQALAETPAFRVGRLPEIQQTLIGISKGSSDRLWRYWSTSEPPKLLAYTGGMTNARLADAQQNQDSREYFQAARRGYSTYQVVLSKTSGRACLNVAHPVFRSLQPSEQRLLDIGSVMGNAQLMSEPVRSDVSGVIVLCIPLQDLGADTGLQELFKDERLSLLAGDNHRDFMRDMRGFDSAVILISNSGQLLFPDVDWNSSRIPSIDELADTALPSLLPIAKRAMRGEEFFTSVGDHGHRYLALSSRVDSAWSLILLLNERKATADVTAIGRLQVLVGALTLLVVLVIIAYRSRAISRPISVAGRALQEISTGNFDVQVSASTDDEIGGLLRNVQVTADRLKAYLREVTSFAITQKQIDTAKAIQQDFLLPSLPSDPAYDVEAFSRPALEIGADWYDMVDVGDYAVLVVADVCDKGVPSALYMSVFRSLIRSKLLDHRGDLDCSERACAAIREAIEQTNDYMASNQNASMMFATVFIAAVNKMTGAVDYVCAGHESPVVRRSSGLEMLTNVGGPAIGLFEGSQYTVASATLSPGDILVIYSDGLIDARSPENEGWGVQRLRDLLDAVNVDRASQVMHAIVTSVDGHMAGADQFDDLTVMVFRWLGT
jgi:sigma-B regulation protein RsbU (phosphoserine phosphatase)